MAPSVCVYSRSVTVPEYSEDKLATSSLIVADQMEKVPTTQIGSGSFVIGTIEAANRSDRRGAVFTIRMPVPAEVKQLDTAA